MSFSVIAKAKGLMPLRLKLTREDDRWVHADSSNFTQFASHDDAYEAAMHRQGNLPDRLITIERV